MVAAVSLPLFAWLYGASWPVLAFTAGAALAIIVLHRTNIRRLVAGEENRMDLRRPRLGASNTVGARLEPK
jgi:glycerol-3-phosphate acyltransferase PlsY